MQRDVLAQSDTLRKANISDFDWFENVPYNLIQELSDNEFANLIVDRYKAFTQFGSKRHDTCYISRLRLGRFKDANDEYLAKKEDLWILRDIFISDFRAVKEPTVEILFNCCLEASEANDYQLNNLDDWDAYQELFKQKFVHDNINKYKLGGRILTSIDIFAKEAVIIEQVRSIVRSYQSNAKAPSNEPKKITRYQIEKYRIIQIADVYLWGKANHLGITKKLVAEIVFKDMNIDANDVGNYVKRYLRTWLNSIYLWEVLYDLLPPESEIHENLDSSTDTE